MSKCTETTGTTIGVKYLTQPINLDLITYDEISKINHVAIGPDIFSPGNIVDTIDLELTGLNVELFGLAWFDHNYQLYDSGECEKAECDVALWTEIMFAKHFLETRKSGGIWAAAGFYNDVIRKAAIAQNSSRHWEISRDLPDYYDRGVNSSAEKEAEQLTESFQQHLRKHLTDEECVIRLSNRVMGVMAWRDGIMISQKLSSAFAQRIGIEPNVETLFLLQRLAVGLFNNAMNYINAVREYGSWELARKDFAELKEDLLRVGQKLLEAQEQK